MLKSVYIRGFILLFLVAAYSVAEAEAFVSGIPATERITIFKTKSPSHKTFLSAATETTEDGDGFEKKGADSVNAAVVSLYSLELESFPLQGIRNNLSLQESLPKVRFYLLHRQIII